MEIIQIICNSKTINRMLVSFDGIFGLYKELNISFLLLIKFQNTIQFITTGLQLTTPETLNHPTSKKMRIAIAGAGDLASYLTEELLKASFDVTILSRSPKPNFPTLSNPRLTFKIVDFASPSSLDAALTDSDVLISTLMDWTMALATIQLELLSACQRSPKCKRFIPSEYGGNMDDPSNDPGFYGVNRIPVREALKQQNEVEWTLLNNGWLMDYQAPRKNRYMKDIGAAYPVDFQTGVVTIPGTGDEEVDFTSARDLSRAIVALCKGTIPWEEIIYVRGERTTYNQIYELLKTTPWGRELELRYVSREELERQKRDGGDEERIIAGFNLHNLNGEGILPDGKVERQREKYFEGVRFRTNADLVKEMLADGEKII